MEIKQGTKVLIRVYAERPHFWNHDGEMDKYMGKVLTIESFEKSFGEQVNYRMKECSGWCFRRNDFYVLDNKLNPNVSFAIKKEKSHANRR